MVKKNQRFYAALIIALAFLSGCRSTSNQKADLIIVNGKVWRGSSEIVCGYVAPTAIAIADNRIIGVGDDHGIRALADEHTRIIDAGKRRIIPGITDSHTHIVSGGLQLARLYLREVKNRGEFIQAVGSDAKTKRPGQWVLGGRWSVESWAQPETPTRYWLDPVTGETPVFLSRMDGHQALVNSAALRLAGIDRNGPPDPVGGDIERDPKTNEPTGILKESAMDLVEKFIPPTSEAELDEAFVRAMKHANSFGITSVHDMSELDHLDVFRRAHHSGAMTLRVTSYLSVPEWSAHYGRVKRFPIHDDTLRVVGFKGYMDGSLGSRTAYMHDHFADSTSESKYPSGQLSAMADPPEKFREAVINANRRGFQLAIHAIGDEGNHLALDDYEAAVAARRWFGLLRRNETRYVQTSLSQSPAVFAKVGVSPPRIEHAQHLLVSDIPRFARIGVVASMQPFHKADDGRYAEKALGKDRLEGSYAFRQLVDAGALLCFGSDWPIVTLNPFVGIDSAVNARTLAGDVWLPEHSLTVDEALRAYTSSPPVAVGQDDRLGSIEEGKLADIVILNRDPLRPSNRERLGEIDVHMTIMNGEIVFQRND